MKCAPIDTDGPRFRVCSIEGYPISQAATVGERRVLVATVIDSFYGTEHGRFASNDCWCDRLGMFRSRGFEGALTAAAERCAELHAWHECEGWGEDVPLAS
jgi:hypothetical protein